MFWTDGTKNCSSSRQPPRRKWVEICHAGSGECFAETSLLLCRKKLSESCVDYHDVWMEVHLRIVWEHVNPELTQRKKSSDSDG